MMCLLNEQIVTPHLKRVDKSTRKLMYLYFRCCYMCLKHSIGVLYVKDQFRACMLVSKPKVSITLPLFICSLSALRQSIPIGSIYSQIRTLQILSLLLDYIFTQLLSFDKYLALCNLIGLDSSRFSSVSPAFLITYLPHFCVCQRIALDDLL